MKVLLAHNYYQHFGGEDMAAESDFRLLQARGYSVRMYSRHNDEIKLYGIGQKAAFPARAVSSARTVSEIGALLDEFPADVAYLHNLYPLISPAIYGALQGRRVPIVQALHDYRPFCANGWMYTNGSVCRRCEGGRFWEAAIHRCMHGSFAISAIYATTLWNLRRSKALDGVDLFVCPSEFCRTQAIRNGIAPERVVVRPHSVDSDSADGQSPPAGRPYFLYLGRLSREKGLWTLMRAFEALPGVELRIAGTGPLEADLRRFLNARGMTNVQLLGFQSGGAKSDLLRNCRALVMPSECFETFGITVIEAYAAGRPVIASDAGALPALVEHGATGLVFERANAEALRQRVTALLVDEPAATRMGQAGRLRAKQEYSPAAAGDSLVRIFETAAARRSAGRSREAACA